MQDIERYYFGCRYSYQEILDNEMAPFKYKTIITKYLKDDIDYETTLESHLYYLTSEGFDYKIYKQLKSRVRVMQYKNPQNPGKGYKEKVYTIEQLVKIPAQKKEELGFVISELYFSKLALLAFSV